MSVKVCNLDIHGMLMLKNAVDDDLPNNLYQVKRTAAIARVNLNVLSKEDYKSCQFNSTAEVKLLKCAKFIYLCMLSKVVGREGCSVGSIRAAT